MLFQRGINMNFFIRTRGNIRTFIGKHELFCNRLMNGLVSLVVLLVIGHFYGYARIITHFWVAPLLALLCAFLPASGAAILIQLYLLLQLMSLSFGVSMTVLVMLVISYALCAAYQAQNVSNFVNIAAFQRLHIPYIIPMQSALLGTAQEVIPVACGSVISFYLKEVYDNAALLKDKQATLLPTELLRDDVISNPLFYIYVTAMTGLFVIVYVIRCMNITHAWLVAVTSGVAAEFILMLGGYLFMGARSRIPELILANIVTFIVGVMSNYLVLDLDYSRIERVQFEDDDYYYYVTAVPKIRIEEEEKTVKRL